MFNCMYSTTLLTWFCKPRHLQIDLWFYRFILVAFNCYQLALGNFQANTIQVQLSSEFNRFPVFGLAHKRLIEFGVVKATFRCELMEERLYQRLLVWGVVTMRRFIVFLIWFSTHPHLFMKRLVWLRHFNFSSEFSEFLGLEYRQTAIYLFCSVVLDSPTVMHQMLNRVRRSKFISSDVSLLNHSFSECLLVLGIVRLPLKCCPPRFLDSLAFINFPTHM